MGDLSSIEKFISESASAFGAANEVLKQSAIRFAGKSTPNGCMLASSVASGSAEAADVQAVACRIREKIELLLKHRIEADIKNKILRKNTSAEALAGLTLATIQGMSVLARDGASRKKILLIAEAAMSAWKL